MIAGVLLSMALAGPASRPVRPPAPAHHAGPTADELKRSAVPELMEKVRALDRSLELDQLVPVAQELVSRADAPLELKRDAWMMLGSALVILGDPVAAERPFTQMLRVSPGFELPSTVEPKVALVFRKVMAEERELARALAIAERADLSRSVTLTPVPLAASKGGQPVPFETAVVDPSQSVRVVRVAYRRRGEPAYSSLALVRDEQGTVWRATLAAGLTENEQGLTLEYYFEASDPQGPLKTAGTAEAPMTLDLAPGRVVTPWRGPVPKWLFFTSAVVAAGASAIGGTLVVNNLEAQRRFTEYTNSGPLSLMLVDQLRADGTVASQRATIGLVVAGSTLLLAGVLALLTDW